MNKNIRASFKLVASLLAAFALASLMACQEPVMIARKKADDQTTTEPTETPVSDSEVGQLPPFTLYYDGKNTVTLSPFAALGTARSLAGYSRENLIGSSANLNYFQWVFMDEAADGVIYAYDDTSKASSLSADLESGHTYHVLLLAGYKPDAATNPTLLASAYTKVETKPGVRAMIMLWMVPVVVDVKFSGGPDGDRQPGRLAKTVGLDKNQTYTLEYFIGSANKNAVGDTLLSAINDGLWPLKLATAEVRQDDTWFYKYSQLVGSGNVRETVEYYQPGVLDDVEVPLNNARGTNLAWVKWMEDNKEAMNDLSVDKVNKKTTGRGTYQFKTPQESERLLGGWNLSPVIGMVWFNMEYVPFSIFDDAMWAKMSGGKLTERPVWVIRNGLNDEKQKNPWDDEGDDPNAWSWTEAIMYNKANGNGGIAVAVVDPAALSAGLYEDNNPWPVPGTYRKTSVEIQAWVDAYCESTQSESGITSVTTNTLAGIREAKGGTYTLLPRRYYAAPKPGPQYTPSGGISGVDSTYRSGDLGTSWQYAYYYIPDLIKLAKANYKLSALPVEIWAAAGVYVPDDRNETFIDISGGMDYLYIYGGFKGTESAPIGSLPTDRSTWFHTYTTLASGNQYGTVIDSARKTTLNSWGRENVTAVKVDGATHLTLDGFTITDSGLSGLWINNAADTTLFTNLEIIDTGKVDAAIPQEGAGIYVSGGAPRLHNLTVIRNNSSNKGGGLCIKGNSTALITNAVFSGNTAPGSGGGIAIWGADARLENIVVTGNKSSLNGGGIYHHGNSVIVNALISGNTTDNETAVGAYNTGGAIYTAQGTMTLVNALISGNKTEVIRTESDSNRSDYGGGGIKVTDSSQLTLINSTVSGNYASYNMGGNTDPLPGAGIYVVNMNGASVVKAYNSLVLGNTGESGLRNDVATLRGGQFIAYNSLVGGYTTAQLDGGYTGPEISNAISGTSIGAGSGNVNGASYATTEAGRLTNLRTFFIAFSALPTQGNTGVEKVASWTTSPLWNFRLGGGADYSAVNGGDATYLSLVSGGVSTDVEGAIRVQSSVPDMGAYETGRTTSLLTYTVSNAKPQSAASTNDGYLTVNNMTQLDIRSGVEVIVVATPNSSYEAKTVTCKTVGGVTVPIINGKFTMPAENVTVDATFTRTPNPFNMFGND
jgi:hypothetical protein